MLHAHLEELLALASQMYGVKYGMLERTKVADKPMMACGQATIQLSRHPVPRAG
jgi:hypothetical protein